MILQERCFPAVSCLAACREKPAAAGICIEDDAAHPINDINLIRQIRDSNGSAVLAVPAMAAGAQASSAAQILCGILAEIQKKYRKF